MAITSTDPVLSFLGIFINYISYITLSANKNSFFPPANPGQAPPDAAGLTATQIDKGIRIYKILCEEYRTFRKFQIILVSMITDN